MGTFFMKRPIGIRQKNIIKVVDYLNNYLYSHPYNNKLPGLRTIMKETQVGRIAVYHALHKLESSCLIKIDPYKGIYRVTSPKSSQNEIRLLNWQIMDADGKNHFFHILYEKLLELANNSGYNLTIENAINKTPEELTNELVSSGVTKCIVSSAFNPEFAILLKKHMQLCMELLPQHAEEVTTELRDSYNMTQIQLEYLFNLGYQRIGYIHFGGNDLVRYPIHILRVLDYYKMMAEKGYKVNPNWVFNIDDNCENIEEGINQILNANPKCEAIIVPSEIFNQLYSYCKKHKIKIGKELAVFANEDTLSMQHPEVTVITNNPENIAEQFWQMFLDLEKGKGTSSSNTQLFIRVGQTVPSIKK